MNSPSVGLLWTQEFLLSPPRDGTIGEEGGTISIIINRSLMDGEPFEVILKA